MDNRRERIIKWLKQPTTTAGRVAKFSIRVAHHFYLNNGGLLSSAVAYNTMLSILPLCLVMTMALTRFFSDQILYGTIFPELATIVPGLDVVLGEVLRAFPDNREFVGGIGLLVMLFFSTVAFRILETAMAVIFHRPKQKFARKLWVSAVIPYFFIGLIGLSVLIITIISTAVNAIPFETFRLLGLRVPLQEVTAMVIHLLALLALVLLFSALYIVLPTSRVRTRRALIGGVTATVLWEGTRLVLAWFFTNVSLVSVVYGSLATMVILLISMEVAALIILFAAQVIAELEHSAGENLPWFEE